MIVLYVQARMASNRLQNKVAFSLGGKPAFVICVERALQYINPDRIVLATTVQANDDPLVFLAQHEGYEIYRGSSCHSLRQSEFVKTLKEDDIFVEVSCDGVLGIWQHALGAIELLKKGWERCWHYGSLGTFRYALSETFLYKRKHHLAMIAKRNQTAISDKPDEHVWMESPRNGAIIVQLSDPLYQKLWPYDCLIMDTPSQALILREIYRDLYEGKPLDHRDVWDYLQDRPLLLSQLQANVPVANQPMHPWGQKGMYEQIRRTVDYIEILVDNGGNYEVIGGTNGKDTKKERKET